MRGHKAMMLSDVWRLSRTSGLSREQRSRKTKIGTEIAHVTRDSDRHFQGQRSGHQAALLTPCWRVRQLQRWAWERVGRGKLLLRCRLLGGARRFGAHGGRRGAGTYRGGRPPTACYYSFVLSGSAALSDVELTQQLTSRKSQRVQLIANSGQYCLEAVHLSSLPSTGVVDVQKVAKEQPVEVVDVMHGVETLTLPSDALQYTRMEYGEGRQHDTIYWFYSAACGTRVTGPASSALLSLTSGSWLAEVHGAAAFIHSPRSRTICTRAAVSSRPGQPH